MKYFVRFALATLFLAFSCTSPQKHNREQGSVTKDQGLPVAKMDEVVHDFGVLIQGEQAVHTFKIKNVGTGDLMITDAKASCGCTVPKFSREPVKPGEYAEVDVVFDSYGREGKQLKSLTVWTNDEVQKHTLQIYADIKISNPK